MSTKLKVGIIGAGGIVRLAHLGGWRNNPNVEVVGIADIDGKRARALATPFPLPEAVCFLRLFAVYQNSFSPDRHRRR